MARGHHLTVLSPFKNYVKGEHIRDEEAIDEALKEYPQNVVQHFPHHPHFYKTDAELEQIRAEAAAAAKPKPAPVVTRDS